jgi:hypothetical protein
MKENWTPMSIRGKYLADADTVHSVLTFHGLYKVFDEYEVISVKIDIVQKMTDDVSEI